MEVQQSDYEFPEDDIIPGADPTAVSGQEKQAKVQALMQILQLGTLNPMVVTQLYLEAHEIPQPEKYMMQPQPKTDPKVEAMKAKAELEKQKATRAIQMNEAKTQMALASKEQEMQMKSRAQAQDMQMKMIEGILKAKQADEMHKASMQQQMQQSQLNMITSAQQAQQKNQQMQEASNTKQKLSKEKKVNANKPK